MAIVKYLSTWQKSLIFKESTLKDALAAISASGGLMACMINEDYQLIGILTDSDIRRALLKGAELHERALKWLQTHPLTAQEDAIESELLELAEINGVREIPLLDSRGRFSDVFVLLVHQQRVRIDEATPLKEFTKPPLPNQMLILAGGLGTRLRSVVNDRPKPLALVGGKPIIETLIMHGVSCGIRSFYVSVNYMADIIAEHLKQPQYKDLKITLLHETERLGTAGSISLIQEEIKYPLLVTNADILTNVPFDKVISHNLKEKADISCTVRANRTVVPFGVVKIKDDKIVSVVEKPTYVDHVNTGIYVLHPDVCKTVKSATYLDMPNLIEEALLASKKVVPFLLHEYWRDIGQPEDFYQANKDYDQHFGDQNEY